MIRSVFPACLFLTALAAGAERPLAEAAAGLAEKQPAGCIVTGERIDGEHRYSLHGDAGPAAIAPERRIFEIGSISKIFTGILLAEAVREKQARFDTTLRDLSGKQFTFKDPKVGDITLLQLATHTSGLPRLPDNLGPDPDGADDPYGAYDRALLHRYLESAELAGAPPFPAAYSNLGMGLLGDLLARLHGRSWEALVKEKITGPLGMKDTVVTLDPEQEKRLQAPHRGEHGHHRWTFQALAGAGALRSTAADLLIFGQALLEPETTPLADAIPSVLEARAPFNDLGAEIGLGVIIGKLDGQKVFEHSGGTGGYRAMLQVLPSRKSVRVVLINNDVLPAELVVAAARDQDLGPASPAVLTAAELEAYRGVYEMGPQAKFTVLRVGEELRVRLTGQPFAPMTPIGDDRFRYEAVAAELRFVRENSEVASLVLVQGGREISAKRISPDPRAVLFPSEEELDAYSGEYELTPERVFTITRRGDTLFARLSGQPEVPVFATRPDYFEYDIVAAAIEFERKEGDGPVTGLILHQNGKHRASKRR